MNRVLMIAVVGFPLGLLAGCASSQYQQGEQAMAMPINCATAQGDIRLLMHEKTHVEQQILAGVKSIVPASAVVGLVTGGEEENVSMATGDYNKKIDEKIAEIKQACGLD